MFVDGRMTSAVSEARAGDSSNDNDYKEPPAQQLVKFLFNNGNVNHAQVQIIAALHKKSKLSLQKYFIAK